MGDALDTRDIADAGALVELERDVAREATRMRLFGAAEVVRKISRFTLLERVGSGGMGTVYAAYDPELDRRVAVKLLDPHASGDIDTDTNARRLLAEARAMAKLSHPNVVTVYEVGVHEESGKTPVVFVAMQFIAGLTLRQWVERRAPDWRRIVAAYVDAGRGLAAVHAAGLIHRDFKPDNAMIADEHERVVVMDFGLAREGSGRRMPLDRTAMQHVGDEVTHDAGVGGTPAYMAPELFSGMPASERTDQFAFCVSLFEGLWGQRPFSGSSLSELVRNLDDGRVFQPPEMRGVPSTVRRAVLRGLDLRPERRFADMAELVEMLDRAIVPRHRARNAAFVAMPAVAAALWISTRGATSASCDPGDAVARVWNDDSRTGVHVALTGAQESGAEELESRLVGRIDAWTQNWAGAFEDACAARDQWSAELVDRAGSCLDGRLTTLAAALSAISRVDLARRSKALDLIMALPAPQQCLDRARLLADVAPPEDAVLEAEVTAVRSELADAAARRRVGEHEGLRDGTRRAYERAQATGYMPVIAEAAIQHGVAASVLGDEAAAIAQLEHAFFTAVAAKDTLAAVDAATPLVTAVSGDADGIQRGRTWAKHARALLAAYPDDLDRSASLDLREADLLRVANDLPGARARVLSAIAAFEQLGRDDSIADAHASLGFLDLRAGDLDDSARAFATALEMAERVYGRQHPGTGDILLGLAAVAQRRGDLESAGTLLGEATQVYEASLGPEHPNVLGSLHNRGSLEQSRGNHAEARAILEDVLARRERALVPDHPDLAGTLGLLSTVYEDLGEFDRAEAVSNRALALARKAYGESHTLVADLLHNLATIAHTRGEFERAIELATQARAIRIPLLGPDHAEVGLAERVLAQAHRDLGQLDRAEQSAREALRIDAASFAPDHHRISESRQLLGEIERRRVTDR